MENYREKIKVQAMIQAAACIILIVFGVLTYDSDLGIVFWSGLTDWRSFSSGAACGVLVVMLVELVRSVLALLDEKKLKKYYVETQDERNNQIYLYALATAMRTFLILGMVAGIIAGYFSMTIGITIIACTVFSAVLGLVFKLYYKKKF